MPTKHINDKTWREVEKATVNAVIATKRTVRESEMLNWLILKGLETITEEDYRRFLKSEK